MIRKLLIGFILSITLLVFSEYFLLEEIYADRRPRVLLFCITGLIISIVSFLYIYKNYRRFTK